MCYYKIYGDHDKVLVPSLLGSMLACVLQLKRCPVLKLLVVGIAVQIALSATDFFLSSTTLQYNRRRYRVSVQKVVAPAKPIYYYHY
ncbi:hypothetical protein GJ496_002117 [Pomphorhynchus laevis]|nr:hypothetical protein GJ496_002117 [Pomphorhynchus laevis]